MARSYNKVTLLGNLGRDPEFRMTPQGNSVCTLNIATTESYKDKSGNWQEVTDWHRVVLWDSRADSAHKYLKKGSKVMIEGKLRTRSYEDQSGTTKYITEVIASNLIFVDSMSGGNGEGNSAPSHSSEAHTNYDNLGGKDSNDEFDDDVPF
jgi:single-strand DNA-binding protein